jgi:hypothetical protein
VEEIGSYLVGGTTPEFTCGGLRKTRGNFNEGSCCPSRELNFDLWNTRHKRKTD